MNNLLSNGLSVRHPLGIENMKKGLYAIKGKPSDRVHVGINPFLAEDPELVVSGINHGANLGDDVIYCSAVAAVTEGRYMGLAGHSGVVGGQSGGSPEGKNFACAG
jgi:5'-nucleotidase